MMIQERKDVPECLQMAFKFSEKYPESVDDANAAESVRFLAKANKEAMKILKRALLELEGNKKLL